MNYNDYYNAVIDDAKEAIDEGIRMGDVNEESDFEDIMESLFIDDSVTGNASGSYTFCSAAAAENIAGFYYDERLRDMILGAGYEINAEFLDNPERIDVIIRCMMLSEVEDIIKAYFEEQIEELEEKNEEYILNDLNSDINRTRLARILVNCDLTNEDDITELADFLEVSQNITFEKTKAKVVERLAWLLTNRF